MQLVSHIITVFMEYFLICKQKRDLFYYEYITSGFDLSNFKFFIYANILKKLPKVHYKNRKN